MALIRILLFIAGIFGAFAFGSWAYVFYRTMVDDLVVLTEPVDYVIAAEFALAVLFTTGCLVAAMVAALRERR